MELTKEQLIKLVQFATGKIHSSFTWEDEAEGVVDDYLKAINYTHCSEQLESKEGNDFWYWCAVNKYARIDNNTFKKGNETIYREELYKYWRSKINPLIV